MNQVSNFPDCFSSAVYDVTDPWQHCQGITGWSHVLEQLTPGPFFGRVRELLLGPIQIIHERVDQSFTYSGSPWKGCRLFVMFPPGAGTVYYDSRPLEAGLLVTHPWDAVDRVVCSHGTECIVLAIDEAILRSYAETVFSSHPLSGQHRSVILNSDPAVSVRFRDGIFDLLDRVSREPSLIVVEHTRRALQRQTLDMLLHVLQMTANSADRLPRSSTRAYVVEKAVEFMEARLAEPIALADICGALRICPRTLRYSFQQVVGVSPARYLLARRLNGARRDLSHGSGERTIEDVAARWGFSHMSRFAYFYRETFGERPSETCQQARPVSPKKVDHEDTVVKQYS